jgi:D-alanine-D-alanine ligase
MIIGIAYDLKSDHAGRVAGHPHGPDDRLEEYDSDDTVDAIATALSVHGHEPVLLGTGRAFIERVLAHPPDLVFNMAEGFGTRSREAHIPSVCEMLGIPVTHSDPLTLAVTLDKSMAKKIAASAGVATPRFVIVDSAARAETIQLQYPLIAKPLYEGSSIGIRKSSRVDDASELHRELTRLLGDYAQPVLVEEFCSGPEFTVGVIGNGSAARPGTATSRSTPPSVSPPEPHPGYFVAAMEIAPRVDQPEKFVYSLEVKRNWRNEVAYHVPPRCPAATLHAVEDLALAAFRALGCRDVARVDVRLTAQGEPRFLEINPLPGLNPTTGDLPILCAKSGISHEELIARIVQHARSRYGL